MESPGNEEERDDRPLYMVCSTAGDESREFAIESKKESENH